MDVYIHIFLTSALFGGEWSASRPRPLYPREEPPVPIGFGGWVDPRTGLDDVGKILDPTGTRNSNPDSVVQPVASRYTDYPIQVPEGLGQLEKKIKKNFIRNRIPDLQTFLLLLFGL
jgi:hypothetical protein